MTSAMVAVLITTVVAVTDGTLNVAVVVVSGVKFFVSIITPNKDFQHPLFLPNFGIISFLLFPLGKPFFNICSRNPPLYCCLFNSHFSSHLHSLPPSFLPFHLPFSLIHESDFPSSLFFSHLYILSLLVPFFLQSSVTFPFLRPSLRIVTFPQ